MNRSLKNVLCLLALVAITSPSFAAITSSPHDFNGDSWNTTNSTQICEVCHAPHGGNTSLTAPLWARATTSQTFVLYDSTVSSSFQGGTPTQPTGTSLLCLSCHDGTLPLDAAGTEIGTVNAAADLGTDLSASHPISFVYDTSAAADGDIKTADATINALLDGGAGGTVQCSSCHDVHDGADQGAAGHLLVMDNTGSQLCITCHDK